MTSAKEYVDEALFIAMHTVRAGIHSTLGSSPRSLTFNRGMFLNIPLIEDWPPSPKTRTFAKKNLMRGN